MSIAAFARERGLPPWRLYQAKRADRRPRAAEFVEVAIPVPDPEPASLEILVGEGTRIRVPAGFDQVTLRQVLEVLASC